MEPENRPVPPPASPPVALNTPPQPPAPSASVQPPPAEEPAGPSRWRSALSTILLFALAPITALLIAAFVVQSYQVDGESMETTLQNNDRLIVDKIPRSLARITHHNFVPKRGTIIIFNQTLDLGNGLTEKQLVKRVIGLPGERVVVNNGSITVYNSQHPDGFNPDNTGLYALHLPSNQPITTAGQVDVTLSGSQIFVCGDNRPNSEDSRFFGPVQLNKVVGVLSFRVLPLSKVHHY